MLVATPATEHMRVYLGLPSARMSRVPPLVNIRKGMPMAVIRR